MYGAQARRLKMAQRVVFENDVEMYGAQAKYSKCYSNHLFENDVEMYGAQAIRRVKMQ